MSLTDVKQALFQTNLDFEPDLVAGVFAFLTSNGVELNPQIIHLQSIAAAAILSQIKLPPKINQQGLMKYGITIQTMMTHLNGYSKEQFLEVLSRLVLKDQNSYMTLSSKIRNVQLSYRLFKKYRKSFQQLWSFTGIGTLVMNDMLSIFWVVYVLIKNKGDQMYGDLNHQTKLIIVLIKSIFQHWIGKVETQVLNKIIQGNFNLRNMQQINQQFFLVHHLLYLGQIQQVYSIRYSAQTIDFKRFVKNAIQIARYLDAATNYFYGQKQSFQIENYIDEISYLQLRNTFAPRPIKRHASIEIQPIKQSLIFQSEQDIHVYDQKQSRKEDLNNYPNCLQKHRENGLQQHQQKGLKKQRRYSVQNQQEKDRYILGQNLSIMTPLRDRRDTAGATPCSSRIANLQWVRNCLDFKPAEETEQQFRRVFSLAHKQDVIEYQLKAKQHLLKLVQEFTPKCIKKHKRVEDILSFFRYFVIRISQGHNELANAQMFDSLKTFNSILCLSSDLFNFAHSSLISSYRKQCQFFDVPLIQALKPINWIGKNIQKPAQMNKYLYSLQKRIVIKQIWQDQTGYNLIKSQQQYTQSYSIGYNDMIIWRRLTKHILDRVQQLAKQVKLQENLIKRVQNLVQQILRQKSYLLNKNKIDQIIICCMTSFLSINQIHQRQTLQKVFKDYHKMQLSYSQNKQGLTGAGRGMVLSEFYNQVFLQEIQDIVRQNIKDTDFLLTPIRNKHQQVAKKQGEMTPFTKKYRENLIQNGATEYNNNLSSFDFKIFASDMSKPLFKKQDSSSPLDLRSCQLANYRKKLFIRNKQMQEEDSQSKIQNFSQNMSGNGNNQMTEQIKLYHQHFKNDNQNL